MGIAILVLAVALGVLVGVMLRVASRSAREPAAASVSLGPIYELVNAAAPATGSSTSSERYAAPRWRILVVDENPLIGRSVTRLLDAHEVAMSTSAEAALSQLAVDNEYDAVLYSLSMPGMSGVTFAAAIAERHPELSSRMVFLIDRSATPETRRLLAVSDVRWVTKPFGYAQLATCVSEIAGQRDAAAQAAAS